MTNTETTATTQHFITDTPAGWTRYNGRCSCGMDFSTNSKSGYTTSTRAHLRSVRKAQERSRVVAEAKAKNAAARAARIADKEGVIGG